MAAAVKLIHKIDGDFVFLGYTFASLGLTVTKNSIERCIAPAPASSSHRRVAEETGQAIPWGR